MMCPSCKQNLSSDDFYQYKSGPRKGYSHIYCKKCWIQYTSEKRRGLNGRYSELKKDAKKNGKEFLLTKEDMKKLWKKRCHYCGNEIDLVSLDRIDNSQPYIKSNVVPCCMWCNYTKGTGSLSFFYEQCKKVVESMPEEFKHIGDIKDCGKRYKDHLYLKD